MRIAKIEASPTAARRSTGDKLGIAGREDETRDKATDLLEQGTMAVLGDCRQIMHQIAPALRMPSRVTADAKPGHATAGATGEAGAKRRERVCDLTETAEA
jgi:hypothetical protein